MKNQHFNEVLLAKALTFKHGGTIQDIPEQYLDASNLPMKQVCAKLTQELSDSIDNVCGILEISKRSFIELALINAIDEFNSIAEQYDIFEPHTAKGGDNA
jgi:hypothetical protein